MYWILLIEVAGFELETPCVQVRRAAFRGICALELKEYYSYKIICRALFGMIASRLTY